jgi:dihydrofolate reductase
MPKLTMTTFLTLDGVMQAPGGAGEDPSGGFKHEGWVVPYFDEDGGKFMAEVFGRADAFLLGRGTYQIFAAHWPRVTDANDPIASKLNALPKHVVSKTLERADWHNATIVRDIVGDAARLKARYPRELQVHGSPGLAQTLLAHDLVDELHLIQFPVVLGSGKRLFGPTAAPTAFKLLATRRTGSGVIINTYARAGKPTYGTFMLE